MDVTSIIENSRCNDDEIDFGKPSWEVDRDFQNLFRAKIGLPTMKITATHVVGRIGYAECKGLYMAEQHIAFPFYGQTAKSLVSRVKRIQKALDHLLKEQ